MVWGRMFLMRWMVVLGGRMRSGGGEVYGNGFAEGFPKELYPVRFYALRL